MSKNYLRPALFLAVFALVAFFGATAAEAACFCTGGSSCGNPIGPFPCGGSVCGSDGHMYNCTNERWVYQSTTCSCAVTPEDEQAMASPADAPLVESLFAQIMSAAPAQAEPATAE